MSVFTTGISTEGNLSLAAFVVQPPSLDPVEAFRCPSVCCRLQICLWTFLLFTLGSILILIVPFRALKCHDSQIQYLSLVSDGCLL